MKYDILLIGGNGFVGRVIAAQLQLAGYSVLVPTSHLGAARELRMLPKIHVEEADVLKGQLQGFLGHWRLDAIFGTDGVKWVGLKASSVLNEFVEGDNLSYLWLINIVKFLFVATIPSDSGKIGGQNHLTDAKLTCVFVINLHVFCVFQTQVTVADSL